MKIAQAMSTIRQLRGLSIQQAADLARGTTDTAGAASRKMWWYHRARGTRPVSAHDLEVILSSRLGREIEFMLGEGEGARECEYCGDLFIPQHWNQRYCRPPDWPAGVPSICRLMAWKQRAEKTAKTGALAVAK